MLDSDKIVTIAKSDQQDYMVCRIGIPDQIEIVCSENGIENLLYANEYHKFVEVDGNKRIYQVYSDYTSGTRYYSTIEWEKGKELVHFIRGEGNMRIHIEFGVDLSEVYQSLEEKFPNWEIRDIR